VPPPPRQRLMPIILCIEDNEKYLRLRKAVLEKEGYAVLSATDSQQAIEMLLEAPVSLVLSDHMLRGTTGVELAQQMKALKPDVPIVLYSGTVPKTLGAVDCYINKSEPISTFTYIIRDLVNRRWR